MDKKPSPEYYLGFPDDSAVKNPAAVQETQETQVPSLGQEDTLEKEMTTHSSIFAGKSHRQRSLVGYSPCCKKLDITESLSTPAHTSIIHPLGLSTDYFVPFNLHNKPMRKVPSSFPFYRWGNWDTCSGHRARKKWSWDLNQCCPAQKPMLLPTRLPGQIYPLHPTLWPPVPI